ncbi:MAG: carboxypeptidase regulatory-like domain-containing protein [bacterium]|nr:carboxypeptidase regulatory-like domain-containing protein [bacterium]
MKRLAPFSVIFVIAISVYLGCQTTSTNDDVTISGNVINELTGDPINQAIVEITAPEEFAGTAKVTDENGAFSFTELTVTESATLTLSIKKTGFVDNTLNVPVSGGLEITLDQPIELSPVETGDGGDGGDDGGQQVSGPSEGAAAIELVSIAESSLNIKETGGTISTEFTFQVQDSAGRNLDLNNAVMVNFSIVSGPGGGEGIVPPTVRTNAAGRATASLFSGNVAGVVQIQAEIVREDVNLTIQSSPVAITIHGGFPTQDGFYLTSDRTNIESSSSQETDITAKLVDEFNNPVKPGTAVYFTTSIGSIEGSQQTQSNNDGEVTVRFWCDGIFGTGVITATTVDQNNQQISQTLDVVCSNSEALIVVNPPNFAVEPGGTQSFTVTVTDVSGRPMAEGTVLNIVDNDASYDLTGNTNITIPNATSTGPGKTEFEFVLEYFGSETNELVIPVTVTSPSGFTTTFNIKGNSSGGEISGPSEGAAVIILDSISETELNISETGGIVNSVLTFQVQDSSGRNVDINNQVTVNFSVLSGPDGGEGLLPESVNTDASGRASTNFYSGNKAGVVQILAEIVRDDVGLTISSKPIALTIFGGFPVEEGVDVFMERKNLEEGGEENINVTLTDEFGNPVKPGTAVSFSTNLGTVAGSAFTNDRGEALINGSNPVWLRCIGLDGNGAAGQGTVTATTTDQNGNPISRNIDFTCSDSQAIITSPVTEFSLDAGGKINIPFTVTNQNGGPMPTGTIIRATAEGSVSITGDDFVELGNIMQPGDGSTEFEITVEDIGNADDVIIISISVETPLQVTTIFNDIRGSSSADGVSGPPSGAATIILTNISDEFINIQGTGGTVNSTFTFQVQDSAGRNLDLNNQIEVNFSILVGPDGGEGLLPETGTTNASGRVITNLYSGTKSGVVQIQAEIVREDIGLTIRSRPIAVTIHGGFPDADHFSLAPSKYNFEGYSINGRTNEITAILGDEFSNPVKPGTAVYFSTTGGVIEGSAQGNTNNQGFASVQLISGARRPNDSQTIDGTPFPRDGLATITASTVDKDNQLIEKSVNVVFSTSAATISANPTTFDLAPGGGDTFTYTVTDLNGNPMAAGTTISVDAGEGIELTGDVNLTLGNYIFPGPGATEFTFSIRDIDDDSNEPADLSINITVVSPSGNETTLTPISGTRRKTF